MTDLKEIIKLALKDTYDDIQEFEGGQGLRDIYRFGPEPFFRWRLMYHLSTNLEANEYLLAPEIRIVKKPHDLGIYKKSKNGLELLLIAELKVTTYNYLFSDQKKDPKKQKTPEIKKYFSKLLESIQFLSEKTEFKLLPQIGLIYYLHSKAPIDDFMAKREFPTEFQKNRKLLSNYFEFIIRESEQDPFLFFET